MNKEETFKIEKIKKGTHHDKTKIGMLLNRLCDDNYNFKEDCIIEWRVVEKAKEVLK